MSSAGQDDTLISPAGHLPHIYYAGQDDTLISLAGKDDALKTVISSAGGSSHIYYAV